MKWTIRLAIAVLFVAVTMFGIRMCTSIQENDARERLAVAS